MARPFERLIAVDFETAWGRKAKLGFSCQTNEEYLRDPRFKAWGLSWQDIDMEHPDIWDGRSEPVNRAVWVRGQDIQRWADRIDWSKTAIVCQNTQFDGSILWWHYDARPCFMFDTLSMGRALYGVDAGNSLKKLAERHGLPPKGDGLAPSENILDTLPFDVEQVLADYCKHDTWLCAQIFLRMLPGFPAKELRLIDMTLRMYVRPLLELDEDMLTDALHEEREQREALLNRLGIEESVLASNPQFAEVLRSLNVEPPMKTSKTTGKKTLALAKSDAMFQAMLNGDNEDVALLCEARMKVKSTTERTRAQRFVDIASRGKLPVPLTYFGAHTGRWTAAKGSAINMQNLKRGSFLRKAIMAPEGYVLVVADLSQIEPRVLAWLADYDEMLDIFRKGGDPYAQFGAQMFGIPGMTKDSHPVQRQSAKSALLGCFGSQTPVLTNRGWVMLSEVRQEDVLWDGVEWVQHQGVVPQGEKEVLTAHGISATSDHEILTEHGWVEWSEVLENPSLLKSALSLGNSPVSSGHADQQARSGSVSQHTSQKCVVHAGGKASWIAPISEAAEQPGAIAAQKRKHTPREWRNSVLNRCAPMSFTVSACLRGSAASSAGAQTRATARIQTMAGAVSRYIRRGLKLASSFFAISWGWKVGIVPSYSLTASTTMGGTSPAICASSLAARTWQTNGASHSAKSKTSSGASTPLKQRMQTYDIAYAGPRNRYTILTDEGPLIVHNCGYQLGWGSFAAQLLTGFLGAPPQRYTKEDAKQLGVDGHYIQRFLDWEQNILRLEEIPHTCTKQELLIHCLAAKKIIDKYRETAHPVTSFWSLCDSLIQRSLADGEEYRHKCLLFRKEEIVLPSGLSLRYPNLRQQKGEDGRPQWVYGPDATKLYAGKITNNVTQGTARVVMTDGMLRIAQRYPVVGSVHDEALALARGEDGQDALNWMIKQMTAEPKYMPGIPLAADGGFHRRYGMAKS